MPRRTEAQRQSARTARTQARSSRRLARTQGQAERRIIQAQGRGQARTIEAQSTGLAAKYDPEGATRGERRRETLSRVGAGVLGLGDTLRDVAGDIFGRGGGGGGGSVDAPLTEERAGVPWLPILGVAAAGAAAWFLMKEDGNV
jgi:hypothetical protein